MLTTFRIGLPGVPFPGPAAHAIREVGHPVQHGMNLGHDVLAVNEDRGAARCTQRYVQYGSVLRDVDLLAPEHVVDAGAQTALLGETDEQWQRLISDPVLRIVEIDARGLCGQPFAASLIVREQLAEMHVAHLPMMVFECLPGRLLGESSIAGSRCGVDAHGMFPADFRDLMPHDGPRGRAIVGSMPYPTCGSRRRTRRRYCPAASNGG